MRDWTHHDLFLNKLAGDIYRQPSDEGHSNLSQKVISHWMSRLTGVRSVLDLGCGEGFCSPYFEEFGIEYEGVTLGDDYLFARDLGRNIKRMDLSFLEYPDQSFDLLFSRHSLEHSFSPLLTLREWWRVSKNWLGVVVPTPEWYGVRGSPNHYYVLYPDQWVNLFENAGWNVIWNETDSLPPSPAFPETLKPHEYWFFCEKKR